MSDAYYYWRVRKREKERSQQSKHRSRSRDRYRERSRTGTPARRTRRRRKASTSPLSNRKRHVGEREAPGEARCLAVFGLSLFTTADELVNVFSKFGSLENCEVVMDKKMGTSRGFAFVTFEDLDDARKAKDSMQDKEIEGRQIRIEFSMTQRAHTPTPGVYLGCPGTEVRRDGEYRRRRRSTSPIRGPRYSPSPVRMRRGRSRSRSRRRHSPAESFSGQESDQQEM